MPEAPNLIQSEKITEETIMAEMMGRLGLARRGQGLVNAQRCTMASRGGRARRGGGGDDAETCFWSVWKQYEVGNYAHSSCLSQDSGIRPLLLCLIISFQNLPFLKKMNNIIIPLISHTHTHTCACGYFFPHTQFYCMLQVINSTPWRQLHFPTSLLQFCCHVTLQLFISVFHLRRCLWPPCKRHREVIESVEMTYLEL